MTRWVDALLSLPEYMPGTEGDASADRWLVYTGVRQVGQARALYNFGNVYHAKGKSICWGGAEPGCFQEEVMAALREAAQYYE